MDENNFFGGGENKESFIKIQRRLSVLPVLGFWAL